MEPEKSVFLLERSEFDRAQSAIRNIFDPVQRLPNRVFQENYGDFCFVEFDRMLAPEFWNLLSDCARAFGDQEIYMSLIDPDPETYYYSEFGRYGVLRLRAELSAASYSASLFDAPSQSQADALQYITSTACWWGNSQRWGFWGERDFGIGIGGRIKKNTAKWPPDSAIPIYGIEEAIDSIIALNFREAPAFKRFQQTFLQVYKPCAKRSLLRP